MIDLNLQCNCERVGRRRRPTALIVLLAFAFGLMADGCNNADQQAVNEAKKQEEASGAVVLDHSPLQGFKGGRRTRPKANVSHTDDGKPSN
jgi:hypothetical protein